MNRRCELRDYGRAYRDHGCRSGRRGGGRSRAGPADRGVRAPAARRRRRRGVVPAVRPAVRAVPRGRPGRLPAAAALFGRDQDQPGRLLQAPPVHRPALGRPGRVHHDRRRAGGLLAARQRRQVARSRAAPPLGRLRDRRGRRPAGRGRRDRDRQAGRAPPSRRHHPRGREPPQRRHRPGRPAHCTRRRGREHRPDQRRRRERPQPDPAERRPGLPAGRRWWSGDRSGLRDRAREGPQALHRSRARHHAEPDRAVHRLHRR